MLKKRRVVALIDGYNLYHGIHDLNEPHLKWLDLLRLVQNFIDPTKQELSNVHYFTAYADHHSKSLRRHRVYVRALESSGVIIELGNFRKRKIKCKKCGQRFGTHEEKGTDVNVATVMIGNAHKDLFDDLFLVSGDADFIKPIKYIETHFPYKSVHVFQPPNRVNHSLINISRKHTQLGKQHLEKALFPELIRTAKGSNITRPEDYNPPSEVMVSPPNHEAG